MVGTIEEGSAGAQVLFGPSIIMSEGTRVTGMLILLRLSSSHPHPHTYGTTEPRVTSVLILACPSPPPSHSHLRHQQNQAEEYARRTSSATRQADAKTASGDTARLDTLKGEMKVRGALVGFQRGLAPFAQEKAAAEVNRKGLSSSLKCA